jgi:hypothetical protein
MPEPLKIAVVTPYHVPNDAQLRQCRQSVLEQTYPCTHIPVADGHPSPIFAEAPRTLHVVLPQSSGDYGNTPRAVGAMLADAYGFDAVAFLDDDNWFEPDHLDIMAATQRETGAPLVACFRRFRHLDGSDLEMTEAVEDNMTHVDANCWLICRPAFPLLGGWRVPKSISYIADRIFFQRAVRERYRIGFTQKRTVNYRTKNPLHYAAGQVAAPAGAYDREELNRLYAGVLNRSARAEIVDAIGFVPRIVL